MFVEEDMLASKWQCLCLDGTRHGPGLHRFSLCEPRTVKARVLLHKVSTDAKLVSL